MREMQTGEMWGDNSEIKKRRDLTRRMMSVVQVDKVTKEQRWQNVTIKQ